MPATYPAIGTQSISLPSSEELSTLSLITWAKGRQGAQDDTVRRFNGLLRRFTILSILFSLGAVMGLS